MQNIFMNVEHVRAVAAVVDEGTIEGGAFVLGVTPSATSQRIRALETRLGQVLIRRTNPITVTEAGEAVLRYAREIELLESETMDRLQGLATGEAGRAEAGRQDRRPPTILRIGVNADSLSTWFRPIFAEAADWDDIVIRIEVVDQDKALPLLNSGEVLGTITSTSRKGYGTRAEKLGAMRYVAVATKGLVEKFGVVEKCEAQGARWGQRSQLGAEVDLESMPMVKFGKDDDLQLDFLARAGVGSTPPVSVVPSSWEFAHAVAAGVGWGLIPVLQLDELNASAELVPLTASPSVEVPLYWHHWTLASEKLSRLTAALHRAAAHMR